MAAARPQSGQRRTDKKERVADIKFFKNSSGTQVDIRECQVNVNFWRRHFDPFLP